MIDTFIDVLFKIRFVVSALTVIFFGAFCVFYIVALKYRPRMHPHYELPGRSYTLYDPGLLKRWREILNKFNSGSPDSRKLAVIEADKLADEILKRLGLEGEHMADRLERVGPEDLDSLEGLWRAHRFRNNLVHSPDFSPAAHEFKSALDDYEKLFKEVGILR